MIIILKVSRPIIIDYQNASTVTAKYFKKRTTFQPYDKQTASSTPTNIRSNLCKNDIRLQLL